jgi:hypothetical protein
MRRARVIATYSALSSSRWRAAFSTSSASALQAGGREQHGLLMDQTSSIADWHTKLDPITPELGAASPAIDKGIVLPNIDDLFTGRAPDLGAIESGCGAPIYGPRPMGIDETNEAVGCTPTDMPGDLLFGDDAGSGGTNKSGGCCQGAPAPSSAPLAALVIISLRRRRDRRRTLTK